MRPFSIRLPLAVYRELEREAARAQVGVSEFARVLIERGLTSQATKGADDTGQDVSGEAKLAGLRAVLFMERAFDRFLATEEGLAERLRQEAGVEAAQFLGLDASGCAGMSSD